VASFGGLARLVSDPLLRADRGRAGHAVLTGEFTQTQVTRRLETLYDKVTTRAAPSCDGTLADKIPHDH
jgi:hypothetical protein